MPDILSARNRPRAVVDPNMPGHVTVTLQNQVMFTMTARAAEELADEIRLRGGHARADATDAPDVYGLPECEQELAAMRVVRNEAVASANQIQLHMQSLQNDMKALQNELKRANAELQQATATVSAREADITDMQAELGVTRDRVAEVEGRLQKSITDLAAATRVVRQRQRAIDWVRRFAEAHHDGQDPTVWLHALTVDIPEACYALTVDIPEAYSEHTGDET